MMGVEGERGEGISWDISLVEQQHCLMPTALDCSVGIYFLPIIKHFLFIYLSYFNI